LTTEEPRKASDILVSLETKVNQMLGIIKNQDLVIKVLTNKLNSFIDTVNSMMEESPETPKQEPAAPVSQQIIAGNSLPVELNPVGFRRTSRPETFEHNAPKKTVPIQVPVVQAPPPQPEVQFPEYVEPKKPTQPKKVKAEPVPVAPKQEPVKLSNTGSKIPVSQRIVTDTGKALFIADIEIYNSDNALAHKTRTNGLGKWEASLVPGAYKVKISKGESLSKPAINITQDILVTGATATQDLPVLIAK